MRAPHLHAAVTGPTCLARSCADSARAERLVPCTLVPGGGAGTFCSVSSPAASPFHWAAPQFCGSEACAHGRGSLLKQGCGRRCAQHRPVAFGCLLGAGCCLAGTVASLICAWLTCDGRINAVLLCWPEPLQPIFSKLLGMPSQRKKHGVCTHAPASHAPARTLATQI